MGLFSAIGDMLGIGTGGIPWGTVAQVGASILGSEAQEDTNQTNVNIANNNSAFNAQQAQLNRDFQSEQAGITRDWTSQQAMRQMDFQERMANSAYQRATADMKAAGLNPMLAYQQGGATTPSGAQGSASTPGGSQASAAANALIGNKMAAGMQSASQVAQIDNMSAQNDNIEADTRKKYAEIVRTATDTGRLGALTDQIRQEMQSFDQRMRKLSQETYNLEQRGRVEYYEGTLASYKWNEITAKIGPAEVQSIVEQAKRLQAMAQLLNLEMPRAVNDAANQTAYKGYWQNVGPFLNQSGQMLNSAGKAAGFLLK